MKASVIARESDMCLCLSILGAGRLVIIPVSALATEVMTRLHAPNIYRHKQMHSTRGHTSCVPPPTTNPPRVGAHSTPTPTPCALSAQT